MDREVAQQLLQGGDGRSPDLMQVTVPARDARGLVMGSAKECEPQVTECERVGIGARVSECDMTGMLGTMLGRTCVPKEFPLPKWWE